LNQKSRIPILAYHKIRPALPDEPRASLVVEPEALVAHLAALRRWGYRLTTLRDLGGTAEIQKTEGESRTRATGEPAVLTFDDGFACLYEHALPILRRGAAPAVIFLVSGRIGGYNDFPGNRDRSRERLLDAGQIRELAEAGIEMGSHTVSHRGLTALGDTELRTELADSRAAIEDLTGRPVLSLAYPYGYLDDRVVAAAREAGYRYACTTLRGTRQALDDPLRLRRVAMGARVGVWRLRYRLSRLYEWEREWKEHGASRRRS